MLDINGIMIPSNPETHSITRILFTGAGGSGKSSMVHYFKKNYEDQMVVIPEISEWLRLSDLPFPLPETIKREYLTEYIHLIITLQETLEDFIIKAYQDSHKILLCDRGIPDTIPYCKMPEKWESTFQRNLIQDLARYDVVFQFAIARNQYKLYSENKPYPLEQAMEHEQQLCRIYQRHPGYSFIAATASFHDKIHSVEEKIRSWL